MRSNINKVSERGERLDSLQDKTDNLAVSAQGFRRGANRVRKQMWWKDMKMRMCIIVGIIILLIIIIVPSKSHTVVGLEERYSRADILRSCGQDQVNVPFRHPVQFNARRGTASTWVYVVEKTSFLVVCEAWPTH